MVIGVTGGIGSGKTTIIKMFQEFDNIAIYNADEEAKKLMHTSKEIRAKLIAEFSNEVYLKGELNRPFLANIVFNDKEKLTLLNSIVHPIVHKHLKDFIKANCAKDYVLYENAILFENGSNSFCDKTITITASLSDRIKRVCMRDGITAEEVLSRIKNQWPQAKKSIQSNYVIFNDTLLKSKQQVSYIHNKLTKK